MAVDCRGLYSSAVACCMAACTRTSCLFAIKHGCAVRDRRRWSSSAFVRVPAG